MQIDRGSMGPCVVLVVGLAAGCRGDDRTPAAGPATFDELVHEIAVVTCAAIEDCGWPVGYLAHAPPVPLAGVTPATGIDVESEGCVAEIQCQYDSGVARELRAAMERGTLIYDSVGAARCLAALRGRCIWLRDAEGGREYLAAMCGDVFTGPDAVGAPCVVDGCTTDDVCTGGFFDSCVSGATCQDGVCVERSDIGEPCAFDLPCRAGLVCREGELGAGTCEPYRGPGAACADGCAEGLGCFGGRCQEPPRVPLGESCVGDDLLPCESGLSCVATADGATCQAPVSSGSACRLGFPDPCPDGEVCLGAAGSEAGTCTTLPGEGAPCLPAFPRCAGDFVCGVDDVCVALSCR